MAKRAKIAIVVMEDITLAMGTTVRVHRLLDLLYEQFDITVIACTDKHLERLERWDNVFILGVGTTPLKYQSVRFLFKLWYIFLWNLRLLDVLLKNKFDVVFSAYDLLGFPAIYFASKIRKFPIVYEAHTVFLRDLEEIGHRGILSKLDGELEKFVIKHSDFVIALSKNTMEFCEEYNPNIDLVPVFIDTDVFHSNQRSTNQDRKLIGLIGPFGNTSLRQRYPPQFLYAQLDKFDSSISFLIIGLCDNRIDHPRIKYTGYVTSIEKYVDCLSSVDAILVVEKVATNGPLNKLVESMSCSLPVFATPKAMLGLYWIEPGQDLLVFEESELVSQINNLIFNDVKMNEISKNARKKIERYYSSKSNKEKLIKILQSFTQGRF